MTVSAAAIEHGGHSSDHHLPRSVKLVQFRTLVIMLLVSDLIFVAGLFFAYIYLRALNVHNMWLPSGVHPPSAASSYLIAGVMLVSAVVYRVADLGSRAGRDGQVRLGLAVAWVLALVDVVLQVQQMASTNFAPSAGAFASSYYALAGYHVFHVAMLLLVGLGIAIRSGRGLYRKSQYNEVALGGLVWYWVTLIAIGIAVLPH
jgi:cytochrome c oxidase subunit 3